MVYKSGALSSEDFELNGSILVYSDVNNVNLNASEEIKSVEVFDLLGRLLFQNNNVGQRLFTISSLQTNKQALFVKIKLMSGQEMTKKIIH